jgi:hypothetical protein
MAKIGAKARKFRAVIVDDRGRMKERRFSTRRKAIQWLEIWGPVSAEGKIERIELYTGLGRLVWSKSFPN